MSEPLEATAEIDHDGDEETMVDQFSVFMQKSFIVTSITGIPAHIIIMGAMEALAFFVAQRLDDKAPPGVVEQMSIDFREMIFRARLVVAQREADESTKQ